MSPTAAAALAQIEAAGGAEMVQRLHDLDAASPVSTIGTAPQPPQRLTSTDYDVVLLGGGLSLLVVPLPGTAVAITP